MADPKDPKEPFVPQADRPEVKIDPEKSVAELSVRDLQSLLGTAAPQKSVADLKPFKVEKFEKLEKHEKNEKLEIKEIKHEKLEIKDLKHEKIEFKDHKVEKFEHKEHKFEKNEKIEFEPIPVPGPPQPGPGPGPEVGGAVGLAQLVEHVGGLHKKIDDLANQIAELKKNK